MGRTGSLKSLCIGPLFMARPLFGHRRGKTHFLVFMKFKEEARNAVH